MFSAHLISTIPSSPSDGGCPGGVRLSSCTPSHMLFVFTTTVKQWKPEVYYKPSCNLWPPCLWPPSTKLSLTEICFATPQVHPSVNDQLTIGLPTQVVWDRTGNRCWPCVCICIIYFASGRRTENPYECVRRTLIPPPWSRKFTPVIIHWWNYRNAPEADMYSEQQDTVV